MIGGRSEMWPKHAEHSEIVDAGSHLRIPAGIDSQFRAHGFEPLTAIGVTMHVGLGYQEAEPVDGSSIW